MIAGIRHWLYLGEIVLALLVGRFLVFALPFHLVAGWLGGTTAPADKDPPGIIALQRATAVARQVARLARRVPWRTTCLVQAFAGWLLLKRRHITATIRFGVAKSDTGLTAHAWLMVGSEIVLGGEIAPDFKALADLGGRSR